MRGERLTDSSREDGLTLPRPMAYGQRIIHQNAANETVSTQFPHFILILESGLEVSRSIAVEIERFQDKPHHALDIKCLLTTLDSPPCVV